MLKARAGNTLIFGLTAVNIQRMMDGQPIAVSLESLGREGRVVILYGKTEAEMEAALNQIGYNKPPS